MTGPGPYQLAYTKQFVAENKAIEAMMRAKKDPVRYRQVMQALDKLEGLRVSPRAKRHWDSRALVHRDDEGRVLRWEGVANDAELGEDDLRWVEYTIEETLDRMGANPLRAWGYLVTSYRVDDGDMKVSLLTTDLLPGLD